MEGYSRHRRFLSDEDGLDVWDNESPAPFLRQDLRQEILYLLVPDLGGREFLVCYTEGVGGVKRDPIVVGAVQSNGSSNGRGIHDLAGPIPEADMPIIKAEMDKHIYEGNLRFSSPHNFTADKSGRLNRVEV